MRRRLGILTCAVIAAVGLGIGAIAAPAPARAAETKARNCVVILSTPKAEMACYDTFRAAIAKATGGRITDAPNDPQAAMRDRRFQARLGAVDAKKGEAPAQADIAPIGVFYSQPNYQGSALIYTGSRPCSQTTTDRDYVAARVSQAWDNAISSFVAYRNCEVMVFDGPNFTGASLPFSTQYANLGLLNDRVSSIIWS